MKTPQLGAALVPIPGSAASTSYDPTASPPLTGPTVQDAIDQLQAEIDALPGAGSFLTTNYGEQADLVTVAAAGASYTIDCSLGNTFDLTLTSNLVLSISNPAPSGVDSHIVIVLRQGGSGSYTVTWPASVKWQSSTGTNTGSAPTLWTAVGAQDVVELSTEDGGTTWGGYLTPHPPVLLTSPLTTKGDLWGWSSTNARLPVGTDGYVPTADSSASLGISYKDPTLVVGPADHAHVVSETHLSDGSTGLYTLDQVFLTGSVIAWNVTTLARLTVTETVPDQATVSPVGSAGDSIVFDYAAVLA